MSRSCNHEAREDAGSKRCSQWSLLTAVLAALFAIGKPPVAEAQSGGLVLGARAGASIATLAYESDPGADIGYRRGLTIGVSATYHLADNLGIRFGGTFASRGAQATFGGRTSVMELSYLDLLPLLDLKAAFVVDDREASLHLLVGPTVSVNRLCELSTTDGNSRAGCEDIDLDVKTVDVGATIGTGFDIQVLRAPAMALAIEVLYTHGLRGFENFIVKNPAKSRGFVVQTGVNFPVG